MQAVEKGLRSHGRDLHAMGTNAMRSKRDWKSVHVWMKREAYIAAARTALVRPAYRQWDHFSFEDYVERHTLTTTFLERHLPRSTGSDTLVSDPPDWAVTPVKRKKKRARAVVTRSVPAPADVSNSAHEVMMFDPVLGKLVPVDSSSEDEEQE